MKKTLLFVLALLGLPLVGLEAQTSLCLLNEVLAARECSRIDMGNPDIRLEECVFTLGRDLRFTTTFSEHSNGNSVGIFRVDYLLPNGNFVIGASDAEGNCIAITTTARNREYPPPAAVLVSPRTGDVYAVPEDIDDCVGDG
jgi:hypothetical protein